MMMQLNGYKGNNMSLGGSSSSQQQLDPAMRDAFLANVTSAQGVAAGLKPREFSGFNPDQEQAFALNRELAKTTSAPNLYATDAANTLMQSSNYLPQNVRYGAYGGTTVDPAAMAAQQGYQAAQAQAAQLSRSAVRDVNAERIAAERIAADKVSGANVTSEALGQIAPQARGNIRDIEAASFLNQNIQQYMNPYTQAVTNQSLADLERSRQLEQQRTAAQATAARAFGGSRQGVAEAETNRAFGENAARLVAQQNAAAYQAAQQASEADLARTMQAQQLNQAQDAATTQQALALAGQFGLANQQAALEAARANQATGLTAAQANQDAMLKAALSNQGYDFNVGQMNTMNQQAVNLANQAAANQAAQFGASAFNQAGLANQAALNARAAQQAGLTQQTGLTNAENFLQANLANQQASLSANQQRIAGASQLASAATNLQNLGFAQSNQLRDQGLIQQGFSQQQLDAIRNLPLEQQQILNQALGINVGGGSGMQQTSSSGQGLFGLFR